MIEPNEGTIMDITTIYIRGISNASDMFSFLKEVSTIVALKEVEMPKESTMSYEGSQEKVYARLYQRDHDKSCFIIID
jgi:hypothetical protein